jgi:hypothetical protein
VDVTPFLTPSFDDPLCIFQTFLTSSHHSFTAFYSLHLIPAFWCIFLYHISLHAPRFPFYRNSVLVSRSDTVINHNNSRQETRTTTTTYKFDRALNLIHQIRMTEINSAGAEPRYESPRLPHHRHYPHPTPFGPSENPTTQTTG